MGFECSMHIHVAETISDWNLSTLRPAKGGGGTRALSSLCETHQVGVSMRPPGQRCSEWPALYHCFVNTWEHQARKKAAGFQSPNGQCERVIRGPSVLRTATIHNKDYCVRVGTPTLAPCSQKSWYHSFHVKWHWHRWNIYWQVPCHDGASVGKVL